MSPVLLMQRRNTNAMEELTPWASGAGAHALKRSALAAWVQMVAPGAGQRLHSLFLTSSSSPGRPWEALHSLAGAAQCLLHMLLPATSLQIGKVGGLEPFSSLPCCRDCRTVPGRTCVAGPASAVWPCWLVRFPV